MSRYAQPSALATTADRIRDMAASLLAAHGSSYGSPRYEYVADAGLAARERHDYAAQLIRDADRRAAAFALRPCAWCGGAITGERVALGDDALHPACCDEYGIELGYGAPDYAFLAPSDVLWAWAPFDLTDVAVWGAPDETALWDAYSAGRVDEAEARGVADCAAYLPAEFGALVPMRRAA